MTTAFIEPTIRQSKNFPKGTDLQMVVGVTTIEGHAFVELRDKIMSRDEFGKGYLFPLDRLPEVIEHLQWLQKYNDTSGARPGAGQQKLPGI